MVRARLLAASLLGGAALLTACGGGRDGDGATPSASTPASRPATAASTPAATSAASATTPAPQQAPADRAPRVQTVATGLEAPWGLARLPGGDVLVSERDTARLLRVPARGGPATVVGRVPGVQAAGEGGLLGLAVSPSFATDRRVFAYETTARDNRIVSFRLGSTKLTPVLTGIRKGVIHDGGRIAFGPDGKLYAGVGETGDTGLAQDRSALNGKILRVNPDGSVPADNPFKGSPVWSYGHRNVQGLAWDRAGRLWATEFGQTTTDEVNLIRKGRNYGWPVREGRGDTDGGRYTNPVVTWSPTSTSSPSGAAIVGGALYVGALAGQRLWRIPLHGTSAGRPRSVLSGRGRIRSVLAVGGGRLWVTTSNRDGRGSPRDGDDRILSLRA